MELTKIQIKEVERIRKNLINFTFKNRNSDRYFTTYSQLVLDCKLPYDNLQRYPQHRRKLGIVLAELLTRELREGRPPLTSIIYGVGLRRPRNGFYITLRNLRYRNTGTMSLDDMCEITFRRRFEKETVEFWGKANIIKKFS